MRSNVAIFGGVLLGATLGLGCLFFLQAGDRDVSPNGAAATKRNASAGRPVAQAPAAVAAKTAPAAATSATAAKAPAAAGAKASATAVQTQGRSGARQALPGGLLAMSASAKKSGATRGGAAVVARQQAPGADTPGAAQKAAGMAQPKNTLEGKIAGYSAGIDLKRPVKVAAGALGPAALAMGHKPAAPAGR